MPYDKKLRYLAAGEKRSGIVLHILQSFFITLSMYTAIPMPMIEWKEKNLKYCMAFLPAAGIIIGAAEWLFFCLCRYFQLSAVFFSAVFCVIPVLITGKIHMDGLIDTCDALGSHGTREKKLKILDDPHVGAFGVSGAILYFLVLFGTAAELYSYLTPETGAVLCFSFAASRALTAGQIVTMELSKETGLLYTFRQAASKGAVLMASAVILSFCFAAALAVFSYGAFFLAASGFFFCLYFRRMVRKHFGGISGDLCGWLIQMQEVVFMLAFLAVFVR